MRNCKEYLEKQPDGTYVLVLRGDLCKESDILVPEGADFYVRSKMYKDNFFFCMDNSGIIETFDTILKNSWHRESTFKTINLSDNYDILWQRDQDEPFLTPESTLNDQYAEIEQVRQQSIEATLAERQSTYGSFEDVAFVTENIMSVLGRVRVNGLSELPHTHRMALYMIASKMARIVNGDFNHLDSWHDIGGYAKLVEKLIDGE